MAFIVNDARERDRHDRRSGAAQMRMHESVGVDLKKMHAEEWGRTEAGGGVLRCHLELPSTYGTANTMSARRCVGEDGGVLL